MPRLLVGIALTLLLAGPAAAQGGKKQTPPTEKQLAELITKLGDAQFKVRQDAYKKLVEIGKRALPQLQKAAQSEVPEIRIRARKAIKEIEAQPAPPPKRGEQAHEKGPLKILDDWVQMTNISETARVAFREWEGPTVTVKYKNGNETVIVLGIRLVATLADLVGGQPTGHIELLTRLPTGSTIFERRAGFRGTFRLVEGKKGRAIAIEGLSGGNLQMTYELAGNKLRLSSDRTVTGFVGDPAIDFSGTYQLKKP